MADRAAGDFGRRLRTAREHRGISLRQISNTTKISVVALEALERNDVSRLPGGIFSRAFVRSYATEVGLDPEEAIKDFIAQFPRDESVTAGHAAVDHVEDREAHESEERVASTVLWLVLVSVPLAGFVLYWASGAHSRAAAPAVPPAAAADVRLDTREPIPEPRPVENAAVVDPAALPPPQAPSPPAAELTVALEAVRPCWISATADGEQVIERLFTAGERQVVTVQRELVLMAGDASAITLTLNGQPARGLGGSGEAVRMRLNPDNYKDYLVSQ